MTNEINGKKVSATIVVLRILIGWHFLYEGVVKMYNPEWTSFGYLASAQGPLKPIFTTLTAEAVIGWVDTLNMVALLLVGITLISGFLERMGSLVGIGLLSLYYLAHPSLPWLQQLNVEGNYWLVNKNLIELVVCVLLYYYPTGHIFGLTYFTRKKELTKI
ncbi:DoxX family membrane protein [Muricauda sp. JGD-17]|uniref:DoxX family membrane protein n=1 Tax=Flagellimonas ochracea TaxID=2696472 RepID=A0A964WYK7_9FLAO|nr:DoxX family membrane protein [Allomuricauda ochracea]NAY93295.1 DoxX family membrane protein [Allomuricauda ochracea]